MVSVERRGIEYIPGDRRWGRPSALLWMWAGAVWNVEFVVYGGLAVAVFGLSFGQAVVIIIVGNLFYVLTGLASVPGPAAGTTTFAISRAPFGPAGNRLPSLFNWVTQVGFEIEGIALIVLAAIALAAKAGFTAGIPAKVAFILLAVAIQGRPGRRDPVRAARGPRRGGGDRGQGRDHHHRAGAGVPGLVRGPLPGLRDRAAVRDQHPGPVLLGRHAAEPGARAAAGLLRGRRHRRGRRLGGSDLSVFMGLVVGGATYWLLAGRSVRAEVSGRP